MRAREWKLHKGDALSIDGNLERSLDLLEIKCFSFDRNERRKM